MKKHFLLAGIAALTFATCSNKPASKLTLSGLDPTKFQTEMSNAQAVLYTSKNKAGMGVCITNFSGRITSIMVSDKNGEMQNIALGSDSIAGYINVPSDFGASVGCYANRINQGRFMLNGNTIQLPRNNFGRCLHGGPKGWQYQVYEVNLIDSTTLELTLISLDGDANLPGSVTTRVTHQLVDGDIIDIKYSATTNKKTIINMINHSYFNLAGDSSKTSTDNVMYMNTDYYTPVDSTFMTTGEIAPAKDTPMGFTTPEAVGEDIDNYGFVQFRDDNGYDHNQVLNIKGNIPQIAARLTSPETGITLEVYTDEPGIQVYTGNLLDGAVSGKKSIVYNQRASIYLETQHYPDSPSKVDQPSVVLEPGQTYNSEYTFKFSTEE